MRTFVLPFAVGLVLAYLLKPIVRWLEPRLPPRNKWPGFRRVSAIIITFILVLGIIGGFLYLIVTAVIDAAGLLVESAPYFLSQSLYQIQQWFDKLVSMLPLELEGLFGTDAVELGAVIGDAIKDFFSTSLTSVPNTINVIMGFAVLPFFLFYILKDSEKLYEGFFSVFTPSAAVHGKAVFSILENVIGRWVRAVLMLGLIVGYFTFVGLLLIDVPFALPLALLNGICEMIPTLGPWIGGIIGGIVVLAVAPDKLIWVILLYVGIQLLENNLLVPKVQSAYLRIHPAAMIVLIVFGLKVAGFWGILLIGPLTATIVEIIKYARKVVKEKETAITITQST